MLDIQFIRDQPDAVRKAIRDKKIGRESLVDELLLVDEDRRRLTAEVQEIQTQSNDASNNIGQLMKAGKRDEAQQYITQTASLKEALKDLESDLDGTLNQFHQLMLEMPNVPHDSVPLGSSPLDNQVVFEQESLPTFSFTAAPHWELIERHNLVDFERGAKVTGAGFPFYKGAGARLQRALINYFLDQAAERGYTELQTPLVVNAESARGTGQLPDKEDQMYEATRDELYLIPTAEVPVTNFLRDEILEEADLPVKYCAYSACFRREAGSYGKDVRGLNRLHQFDKVELVRFVTPASSYDALEEMRSETEALLQSLELPYRTLLMCSADMGFTQAKKYDLEVWSAGQERWLEVSSISNFESFQARRMKIRYRPHGGAKPVILHTLNGSALALPRIVAALLENNQRSDGTIDIPAALQHYTGFDRIGV